MRRFLLTIALAALALPVGCDTTAPEEAYVGTYTLARLDGRPLPTSYLSTTIVASSLTLNRDDTFSRTITYTASTETQTGTWSWMRDSGEFRFVLADGTPLFYGFAADDDKSSGLELQSGLDLQSSSMWSYRR